MPIYHRYRTTCEMFRFGEISQLFISIIYREFIILYIESSILHIESSLVSVTFTVMCFDSAMFIERIHWYN